MNQKYICVAIIAFLVLYDVAEGKKSKRNKRPKTEDEDPSTPQPSVISYSTFGFNDVGSYEGFIPSSPDYAKFLTTVNQDSTTRLYPSMFPATAETTGFDSNYDSHSFDGPAFGVSDISGPQSSMPQYPQNTMNFFNTPSFETIEDQNKNIATEDIYGRNKDDFNEPVYGTKINFRNKNKSINQFNHSEFNQYASGPSHDKYFNFHELQPTIENKPTHGESSSNYQNNMNNYIPTNPTTEINNFEKPSSNNGNGLLKFPKEVDFTKFKQYYPSGLDNTKIPTASPIPSNAYNSIPGDHTENIFTNTFSDHSNKFINPTPIFNGAYEFKNNEPVTEKDKVKFNSYSDSSSSYNYPTTSDIKNILPTTKYNTDYKKKLKNKPWSFGNFSSDFKKWKSPYTSKGYEYSTNYSNTRFKYDVDESRKPFTGNDEVKPSSTNFDFGYQQPETDYSSFKKMPDFKEDNDDDYNSFPSYKDAAKPKDQINQYKDLFTTIPTTKSYWGNNFKTSEYSSFKNHPKKTQYNDDINDDIVNIPKRPSKWNNVKHLESGPIIDWSYVHHNPYKVNKQLKDWNKEVSNRFKSEEDLLGLRTHDTSHPSYLPTYKPEDVPDDSDYKKLVDKWTQSYLRSKYKDSSFRDYESYASEMKPLHVPVPKPYPIEVPHPVIVPVPQPYPVRVPVAKPVAVPVVREITVPIEKPVPYPVVKKVPYPVEKLVPVPVEKEVAVPVIKPYPVHIPYVRPVFHHKRPSHDEFDSDHVDDDDYFPRMESNKKNVQYKRRPHGARNRRPSQTIYQDRNRRRWPDRRRPSTLNGDQRSHKRPSAVELQFPSTYKYHDFASETMSNGNSDYFQYCKRSGNC